MKRYVMESWLLLFEVDCFLHLRSLKALHSQVRRAKVNGMGSTTRPSSEILCRAIDYACVFYFKRAPCLQRSAATTLLLRRYGWPAELVIGAQMLPFKSHAWVEMAGKVVNDKPYMLEIYQVLERC